MAWAKKKESSSRIGKIDTGKKNLEAAEQDLTGPYENQIEPNQRKKNKA
jgi:hypothetical protein